MSLGEILAIEPMLNALAGDKRNEIFLTTTTSTGYAMAKSKYGGILIGLAYFPLDFWPFSRRVWGQVEPDIAICAETEIWPEHLRQAGKRGAPLLLVNARLSDRSFKYASRFASFTQKELGFISEVLAGSQRDKDRFESLGIAPQRVAVTGNMKVDVSIEPALDEAARLSMKRELGLGDGIVLLGSGTWAAEERMLIAAFKRLRDFDDNGRLLIVPRHAERREELARFLARAAGSFSYRFKSSGERQRNVDILVADTHGELRMLTQLADLAFIGKSLPPENEGQTPIEACALGVPTLFGPGMRNFPGIREQLLSYGAARQVSDEPAAIAEIIALIKDPEARSRMSEAGLKWHRENRGAVAATLQSINAYLDRI